jgi:hypothetical protein
VSTLPRFHARGARLENSITSLDNYQLHSTPRSIDAGYMPISFVNAYDLPAAVMSTSSNPMI